MIISSKLASEKVNLHQEQKSHEPNLHSWKIGSSDWETWTTIFMKRSAPILKKQTLALAKRAMAHCSESGSGFYLQRVRRSWSRQVPFGHHRTAALHEWDAHTAFERDARLFAGCPRESSLPGLRIQTGLNSRWGHSLWAAGWEALHRDHRPMVQGRMGSDDAKSVDELYPQANKILVVMDNLNQHTPVAFIKSLNQEKPDAGWSG